VLGNTGRLKNSEPLKRQRLLFSGYRRTFKKIIIRQQWGWYNSHMKIDLKKLKHLFWDTDLEKIDHVENSYFIIERALRYGLPEDIRLIVKTYTKEEIVNVVKTSRTIDRKTARFWSVHFNIPEEEILCLKRQLLQKFFY
jgi:hypothetical protein